jgi:hypothetical protein
MDNPPVFRLSLELTLYIFSFCGPRAYADMLMDPDNRDNHQLHSLEALTNSFSCTRVCRLWRQYTSDDPTLWTTPLLRFPTIARASIARAATLNLCVRYPTALSSWGDRIDGDHFPSSVYYTLHDFNRVRELALSATVTGWSDLLYNYARSAPNLEILRMNVESDTATEDSVWSIPVDAFDALAPLTNLRRMQCRLCIPNPNTSIIRHLTDLDLDCDVDQHHYAAHSVDLKDVLHVLRFTQNLRRLGLTCVSTVGDSCDIIAHLPLLERL